MYGEVPLLRAGGKRGEEVGLGHQLGLAAHALEKRGHPPASLKMKMRV